MLSITLDDAERVGPDGYSPERQRAIAARRHADACEQARKAREEFEILEATGSRHEVIRIARARMDAADVLRRRHEAIVRSLGAAV